MATSKEEDKRRAESQRLARDLFGSFREEDGIAEIESVKTDGSLKKEVADIFEQAHAHRDKLVRFLLYIRGCFLVLLPCLFLAKH